MRTSGWLRGSWGYGFLLPYRLNTLNSAAAAVPSLSHDWGPQHSALDGGKMDNWVPAHIAADGPVNGPYTMGYYTRQDIPFQYALADGPSLTTSGPNAEFTWTTYPERLEAAGVSWKFYHEANTATGLPTLNHFTQYFTAQPGNPLYDKAMANSPVGSFEYDVANDQLPTVSWLLPPAGFDEHPNASPAAGATYVAAKIDALAANPDVWAKTVFILSYDENDGFFDHVIPPVPPPGTSDEYVTLTSKSGTDGDDLPVGPGYRVPCIIVSPWTVGGWVCTELSDHTSQLRFLEQITGVTETNISQWRRDTVGDLTSAFRFGQPDYNPPSLPDTSGQYNLSQYEISQFPLPTPPTTNQRMPGQEPGRRPHIP